MSEAEIRQIASSIVAKAKATARVKQGRLKRSIAYTYVRGLVTFRQVYWGSFKDNSLLEKLASQFMPKGVPYKIELTVLGGDVYEKGVTKQGRSSVKRAVKEAQNTNSSSIKKLVALVKKKRKDGEEKDENTD
jgi:hypothetical protein